VTVAATRNLRFTGGVSVSQLSPVADALPDFHANAFVAGASYTWSRAEERGGRDGPRHELDAGYELRAGLEALDSDLEYRRHLAHVRYRAEGRDSRLI